MRHGSIVLAVWLISAVSTGCQQLPWNSSPAESRALADYVYPRHLEHARIVEGPGVSTSVAPKQSTEVEGVGEAFVKKDAPRRLPPPPKPVVVEQKDRPPVLPDPEPMVAVAPASLPIEGPKTVPSLLDDAPPNQPQIETVSNAPPPTVVPITTVKNEEPAKKVPLVEALRCVLEDRPQEALQHLQAYDPETQEICLQFLPTLTMFTKKRLDQFTSQDVAVLNDQLHGMLSKLRPRTELAIDAICFCEWVKGYGIYQPVPKNHSFQPEGKDKPGDFVQLYVEIRNFACEPTKEGFFETRLTSSMEVKNSKGEKVWHHDFKDPPRRTRAQLQDYCNNYCFSVPPLEPGVYQLTLQVVDETLKETRRVARKSIELRVAAGSSRLLPR